MQNQVQPSLLFLIGNAKGSQSSYGFQDHPGGDHSVQCDAACSASPKCGIKVGVQPERDFSLWLDRRDADALALQANRAGDLVEILNGLSGGEQVVTEGSFLLKGQLLRATLGEDEEAD